MYLSRLPRPPVVLHPPLLALHCRTFRGKTFTKSARSWIRQERSCAAFLSWVRERMSVALSSKQSWCRLSMLPRVDCEAIRRAEERACHSIVRFEVQFNVVVVDMWNKDWAMTLHSSSLMSWLWSACTLSLCIGFYLRAGGRQVSRNVERIRRLTVEHSAPRMIRLICTSFKSRRLTMTYSMRCQLLDQGCIKEFLCMTRSWKVFVMARPN